MPLHPSIRMHEKGMFMILKASAAWLGGDVLLLCNSLSNGEREGEIQAASLGALRMLFSSEINNASLA